MVTNAIIVVCISIYLYGTYGIKEENKTIRSLKCGALYSLHVDHSGQYWRFLTANFVHLSILHLFFTMYALHFIGSYFEVLFGPLGYCYLLVCSGVGASLSTYLYAQKFQAKSNVVTMGANALFDGFIGSVLVLAWVLQGVYLDLVVRYAPFLFINGIVILSMPGVSRAGHIGGFLFGSLATCMLLLGGLCI